jgi:hypothetical protein
MSNTNGLEYSGFEINGNLTVREDCCNSCGNGSIEAAGSLYIGEIVEYNLNSGVTIEQTLLNSGTVNIPSTIPGISLTSGALIIQGGFFVNNDSMIKGILTISNTTESISLTSGSLIVDAGASIKGNLNVGNILQLYNTIPSTNSSLGALLSLGGISIQNTANATSCINGGALTVLGGAGIAKDLYVCGTLYAPNLSIGNINVSSFTSNNFVATNASISTLINTNLINTNATITNGLLTNSNITNSSITNLNVLIASAGTLMVDNEYSLNSTVTNLNLINGTLSNFVGSNGEMTNMTITNLVVMNNLEYNDIITNLSTSNIISQYSTITNLLLTNSTFTNLVGINISSSNIITNNILSNIGSIGNVYFINQTVQNLVNVYSSIANLVSSNLNSSNGNFINLTTSNIVSTNQTISNLYTNIISNSNLYSNNGTINSLYLSGTDPSVSSTNGVLILLGGITILNTTNAISTTNGGGLTIYGGMAINKDIYIGGSVNATSISTSNINISNQINSPYANLVNITSNILQITGTNASSNSSTGSIISLGGISINNTTDATSITSGGGFTDAGGASIAKSLYVGGTVNATSISADNIITVLLNSINANVTNGNIINLNGINASIANTSFVNSTINSLVSTSISNSNLNSQLATIQNLLVGNISFGNAIGNNLTSNYITNNIYITSPLATIGNLINTNGTINSININQGTFGSLLGTYLHVYNATIDTLISTDSSIGTLNVNSSTLGNIFTNAITGTSANFLYLTVGNLTISNIVGTYATFSNLVINSGIPSYNSTTASLIIYGGLSINDTVNATNVSSGGGLTISGGLAVSLDTYIGGMTWLSGGLDVNGTKITNCTAPSLNLDVVNLWYLENKFTTGNVNGNFTQGQVIIATTSGNIIGYPSFTFDYTQNLLTLFGTNDATSISSGGTLQVYGGASINLQLFVGSNAHILGYLDMNNQIIMNVATCTMPYEAANKYYVDSKTYGNVNGNFTQGQVIIGGLSNTLVGFSNFTFDSQLLSILTTIPAIGLGSGGSLNVYGGVSILENVYIGGGLDVNGQKITNCTAPTLDLDVVNLWYLQNQFTTGNVNGNFTQGQVIIAGTGGNITGYQSFTFDHIQELLSIYGTTSAIGLGSGGSLNVYGGVSILENVYIGGGLDVNGQKITNCTAPTLDLDVVNLWYLQNQFTTGNVNGNFTQGQVIIAGSGGNILGYSNFLYNTNGSIYIGGGLSLGNSILTGVPDPINPTDAVNLEYLLTLLGDNYETSVTLANNILIPTNIPGFVFSNYTVSSFNALAYLKIPELNIYDQFEIKGIFEGNNTTGNWVINTSFIGVNQNNVKFSIINNGTEGQIQYINKNTTGNAVLRFKSKTTSQGIYTSITTAPLIISDVNGGGTGTTFFTNGCLLFGNGFNPIETNLALMYTNGSLFAGNGININNSKITNCTAPNSDLDVANKWYVDQFLGTGGSFTTTMTLSGTIDATSTTYGGTLTDFGGASIAKSLYVGGITHLQNTSTSTSPTNGSVIILGGLGVNNIYTNQITSTNGSFVNITTNNLIGINSTLSNLNLTNLTNVNGNITNLSTSNLSTSNLSVNTVNMTPSLGDLFYEQSFSANNNQVVAANITGFSFNNSLVRYFDAYVSVTITATNDLIGGYKIEGIQTNSSGSWLLNTKFIGQNTGVKFSINTSGNIQYKSPNIAGFVSNIIKFRASTLTI